MKILIVTKFLYDRGGAEIYAINLGKMLKKHGHKVCFFAMNYEENDTYPESKYFASEIKINSKRLADKIMAVPRVFGVGIRKNFQNLLDDFMPDIVHLNNIHSYISPVVAQIAKENNIPVVWTVHDFKLTCPIYSGLRNGVICDLCLKNKFNVIRYKCMKNSYIKSIIAFLEAKYWNIEKLQKYTDIFITPSDFLRKELVLGGCAPQKIKTVLHSIPRDIDLKILEKRCDEYCYVGRLSYEKGLLSLISVAKELKYKLRIIGDGPMRKDLEFMAEGCKNIVFDGFKDWNGIKEIIGRARFVVIPSEWKEIFGLVSIESQSLGTPVLCANIGGLPETILEGETGMLFESRNKSDLKGKIEKMFFKNFDNIMIAEWARNKFSEEIYYNHIYNIYTEL